MPFTAHLLINSGAENPWTTLTDEESRVALDMVRALKTPAAGPPVGTLGVRGASLWLDGQSPVGAVVHKGVVSVYQTDNSEPKYFRDTVGFESYLTSLFPDL